MKFYVAKLVYDTGDLAHPWTLFAESLPEAVARINLDGVKTLVVKERPMSDASFFGRDEPGPALVEHTDIFWTPE